MQWLCKFCWDFPCIQRIFFKRCHFESNILKTEHCKIHLLFENNLSCNKEKLINPDFINLLLIHAIFKCVFWIDRPTVNLINRMLRGWNGPLK